MAPLSAAAATPVLFDNGFFGHLTNPKRHEGFVAKLTASGPNEVAQYFSAPYGPLRTPFAFLEWIGIVPNKKLRVPDAVFEQHIESMEIPALFSKIRDHYASQESLAWQILKQRASDQRSHTVPGMLPFFDFIVAPFVASAEHLHLIYDALAFDRIHTFDARGERRIEFFAALIAHGVFSDIPAVRNLSKFRAVKRLWHFWQGDHRTLMPDVDAALNLDNHADYLDSDLVHAAVFGHEFHGSPPVPAVCFTCDTVETVKNRIEAYKGFLRLARRMFPKLATHYGFGEDFHSQFNGTIYYYTHAGEFVHVMKVSEETRPLRFHPHGVDR